MTPRDKLPTAESVLAWIVLSALLWCAIVAAGGMVL
jgi:hypothetical protein